MKIYLYSKNKEIKERLAEILSTTEFSVKSFSSIQKLTNSLATLIPVNLIYHLDINTSAESELETIQKKIRKKVNTLVLTNTPDPEQGVRLLNLNIRGYANTYIDPEKLIMALSVVRQGEIWAGAALIQYMLSKSIIEKNSSAILEESEEQKQSVFHLLTEREQQIAQKILLGLQNKLIASELFITERTVKAHLSTIFKKLGVRNRLELTLKLQQADRRVFT